MERYEVVITRSAFKEIERIATKVDRSRVMRRIRGLADDPCPPGCEKPTGRDRYRVRQGWYRIIYGVDDDTHTVIVVKVGHRRDVYR